MAQKALPVSSLIIGIDLVPIRAIRGVRTIVGDITTQKARQVCCSAPACFAIGDAKWHHCKLCAGISRNAFHCMYQQLSREQRASERIRVSY